MPATYTFFVAPSTGAATGAVARAVVPFSRRLDPVTGELHFDDARRSWSAAESPMAEVLVRCLNTRKGTAGRDPSYGIDLAGLDNARENAEATARAAVEDALARYRPRLESLEIDTEIQGEALVLEVRFRDRQKREGALTGLPQ